MSELIREAYSFRDRDFDSTLKLIGIKPAPRKSPKIPRGAKGLLKKFYKIKEELKKEFEIKGPTVVPAGEYVFFGYKGKLRDKLLSSLELDISLYIKKGKKHYDSKWHFILGIPSSTLSPAEEEEFKKHSFEDGYLKKDWYLVNPCKKELNKTLREIKTLYRKLVKVKKKKLKIRP